MHILTGEKYIEHWISVPAIFTIGCYLPMQLVESLFFAVRPGHVVQVSGVPSLSESTHKVHPFIPQATK